MEFPTNWHIAADYDPNNHLMQLKGRDYLNVQNRLLWFIRDQRSFISKGLARVPYVVQTELVEMDRDAGFAHFKTYVRDVLGNEATMYGSESAKDFGDFAEKASTKSLGRALLQLGYGTAFAPEMDEGERVVDAPVERKRTPAAYAAPRNARSSETMSFGDFSLNLRQGFNMSPMDAAKLLGINPNDFKSLDRRLDDDINEITRIVNERETQPTQKAASSPNEPMATEQQTTSIRKLCEALGKPEPANPLTLAQAREIISDLSQQYQQMRRAG